jgi:predicted amidohydrolase
MAGTRDPGRESVITVAAIQSRARTGEKDANNEAALEALHTAADDGGRLLVLPELGNSGYVFDSREEALSLAEPALART